MKHMKLIALLCALGMLAAAGGCGTDNKNSSTPTETTITAETQAETTETEVETEPKIEETTEALTEETSEAKIAEANAPLDSDMLDSIGSLHSLNYRYNSDWEIDGDSNDEQLIYRMPDGDNGSIIFQYIDGSGYDDMDANEVLEMYAENTSAIADIDSLTVIEDGWNEKLIADRKCYVLKYQFVIASIKTECMSVFFTNYTDDAQDIFALSSTTIGDRVDTAAFAEEILRTMTFSSNSSTPNLQEEDEDTELTSDDVDTILDIEADPSVDNGTVDSEGTCGNMIYPYSSDWLVQESSNQINCQMPDNSGGFIFQNFDASSFGGEILSEEQMIELLAEYSEDAWSVFDGMEILDSKWSEDLVPGKKCYVVDYTYEIASIPTTDTTVFFANFTDDIQELYAVTIAEIIPGSNVFTYMEEVLQGITFAE